MSRIAALAGLLFLSATALAGPLDELDRGHRILIEQGLQIQALALDTAVFDPAVWDASYFTTVNFWAAPNISLLAPAPDTPWARWFGGRDIPPDVTLSPAELAYIDGLRSLQAGDEQDLTNPATAQQAADTLASWRSLYPDKLGTLSQQTKFLQNYVAVRDLVQPDLVCSGTYDLNDPELWIESPIIEPVRRGGSLQKTYAQFQIIRQAGLAGHDGSGDKPIPYGVYTQTFNLPQENDEDYEFEISESQIRLNQFAAWAFGFKWVCAFVYNAVPAQHGGITSVFFPGGNETSGTTPQFAYSAQTNFEARNLGPALVRLLSTDVRIVSGRFINEYCIAPGGGFVSCQQQIPLPRGVAAWTPGIDPYMTSVRPTNIGTKNEGLPGDIIVGYFKPLHEDFDGPGFTNETYFMVVNSLAYIGASSADTKQRVRLDFDFGNSGITSLQRLSRFTGQVDTVPLTPLGGSRYFVELEYGGGEGDLFKFNSSAPFITANSPATPSGIEVKIDAGALLNVHRGDRVELNASVSGASGTVSYQWYRDDGSAAKLPQTLTGETAPSYVIFDAGFADAGAYWVEVTANSQTYISNTVNLSVTEAVPLAGPLPLALYAIGMAMGGAAFVRRRR